MDRFNDDLIQSHDKFFKYLFSKVEVAKDFIKHTLPPEIVEKLQLDTLKLDPNEYIDNKLKQHFADIVYHCKFGEEEVEIALLFEHKSQPDKYVQVQLLRYMTNIWNNQIDQNIDLTPIIPIVFYHGKKKWNIKSAIFYAKWNKGLLKYAPSFEFEFFDVNNLTEEQIVNMFEVYILRAGLITVKNIYDKISLAKQFVAYILDEIEPYIDNREGDDLLTALIIYILSNVEDSETFLQNLINMLKTKSPKASKRVLTIAERLIEKGRQEGWQKGLQEGLQEGWRKGEKHAKLEIAKKLLSLGFDIQSVVNVTGLSYEEVKKLKDD